MCQAEEGVERRRVPPPFGPLGRCPHLAAWGHTQQISCGGSTVAASGARGTTVERVADFAPKPSGESFTGSLRGHVRRTHTLRFLFALLSPFGVAPRYLRVTSLFPPSDMRRNGHDDDDDDWLQNFLLLSGRPLQHNQADVPLHQMTASAVGNTPEKDLDIVKEGILRGVMHADEHMFEFKVNYASTSSLLRGIYVNVGLTIISPAVAGAKLSQGVL